eukprot:TRINITY_DN27986_c0_g1_i1.p1 TRINITY_DN27986_c0_g1~~TRINITY_DN27986_c0_g1_i1.p1  ORF type:complete len:167 (+),score=21.63 TRINITY_DN27986_c0_g1_i1:197-697(+)
MAQFGVWENEPGTNHMVPILLRTEAADEIEGKITMNRPSVFSNELLLDFEDVVQRHYQMDWNNTCYFTTINPNPNTRKINQNSFKTENLSAPERVVNKPSKKRKRNYKPPSCLHCGQSETPEWRKGPLGKNTLCNACGLQCSRIKREKRCEAGKVSFILNNDNECG